MLDLFWICNHTNYMYMYSLAHIEIHIHQIAAYDVRLSLLFCNGELADSRSILFNRGYKSFKIVWIFFHIYSYIFNINLNANFVGVFFLHYDSFNCINQNYCNKTFRILKSSWIDFILCSPKRGRGSLSYCFGDFVKNGFATNRS